VVRKDWCEYLASIEVADESLQTPLEILRASGQETNTIVVFMGDHGPAFPHGKMTLYELGLRVPLILRVPWLKGGFHSDALVSELDLMPTLLDLLSLAPTAKSHGLSLKPILEGKPDAKAHQYIFAEISNKGPLPNDGMQERSLSDGRWKLIYRENVEHPWRTVQDDSKFWKTWGNRTYDETVRLKDKFPEHYRILAELDPQTLGGKVPALELYDLQSDPDEMHNLVGDQKHRAELERLYAVLCQWERDTDDPAVHPPSTLPRN
jgi:N-sulfoglucosamine sulfohydrolase